MPPISFHSDGVTYQLKDKLKIKRWLLELVHVEGKELGLVNVVITNDEKLKKINTEFLNHDYLTDIITFQYDPSMVEGEVYISLERVMENSKENEASLVDELHRVIAHGFLHMCGYKDKKNAEKTEMRAREDFYLTSRKF